MWGVPPPLGTMSDKLSVQRQSQPDLLAWLHPTCSIKTPCFRTHRWTLGQEKPSGRFQDPSGPLKQAEIIGRAPPA